MLIIVTGKEDRYGARVDRSNLFIIKIYSVIYRLRYYLLYKNGKYIKMEDSYVEL